MDFENAPWYAGYADTPRHLVYPDVTMYGGLEAAAAKYPKYTALEFMGFKFSYRAFLIRVNNCARALAHYGVKAGDKVTICLPNVPQAPELVYAVNKLGAVANMVHPLSAEKEIEFYLNDSESVLAVTLDQFVSKFKAVSANTPRLKTLVVTSACDALPLPMRIINRFQTKKEHLEAARGVLSYREFLLGGLKEVLTPVSCHASDDAVILYSGGTTGVSKGIVLSNNAFNAIALQVCATNPMFTAGDKLLAVLPLFHGFGLGVCIHAMMFNGGESILVPRFNLKAFARALVRKKPNFIAGVPTMYEALLHLESVKKLDLGFFHGIYCGGDSLGRDLKKRIDDFLFAHGSPVPIREGYGLTECIAVSCLTPYNAHREGSVGLPLPDMFFRITRPGTDEELPYGEEGEICVCGPSVMTRYANNPEETEAVLHTDEDGHVWLHTGDLGKMDSDGYVYFMQRLKRMIVTSGYNVYPSQIEALLDAHEAVHMSCVVGVPDPYRIHKVKAFVVLRKGIEPCDAVKAELDSYMRKNVAKYAVPREYVFRDSLPMTKMNKIDYRALENE